MPKAAKEEGKRGKVKGSKKESHIDISEITICPGRRGAKRLRDPTASGGAYGAAT